MTKLAKQVNYESNPFNVRIPPAIDRLGPEVVEFLQDLVSTLREQHNATQMGDTSVSWEALTQVDDTKSFSLGSLGRFLHPDYGIITARYVEFTGEGVTSAEYDFALVAGFDRSETNHQWAVSTKFADSGAVEALGFCAGYTRPRVGQFGWVITTGINLQSVRFNGEISPAIGDRLIWSDDTGVMKGESGVILGVVASLAGLKQFSSQWELAPASIRVGTA